MRAMKPRGASGGSSPKGGVGGRSVGCINLSASGWNDMRRHAGHCSSSLVEGSGRACELLDVFCALVACAEPPEGSLCALPPATTCWPFSLLSRLHEPHPLLDYPLHPSADLLARWLGGLLESRLSQGHLPQGKETIDFSLKTPNDDLQPGHLPGSPGERRNWREGGRN